jgi:hypothetical protein
MALTIEIGQGISDAESYASVDDADTYFTNRGITIWGDVTVVEKEQALRRATDYMTQNYRGRWLGARRTIEQALDWPRVNVQITVDGEWVYGFNYFPFDKVPNEVKRACIELALRASMGELTEDTSQAVLLETIGPITTEYDPYSIRQKQYPAVDAILKPYLSGRTGGATMKLSRT